MGLTRLRKRHLKVQPELCHSVSKPILVNWHVPENKNDGSELLYDKWLHKHAKKKEQNKDTPTMFQSSFLTSKHSSTFAELFLPSVELNAG